MTREEAAKQWEWVIENFNDSSVYLWPDQRQELLASIALLRVPDPDTGLVPCGCGGKAQIINSSGYSRRLYVECDRCNIMLGVEATGDGALQGIYRYDDQIIEDWNRAMGLPEVDDD